MPDLVRRTPPLACLAVVLAASGCDSVGRYISERPEDRLVEEAVAQWTERGHPFLDDVSGADTVASVTATGARGWEVAVGPPEGGLPTVWALEIPRAEVYPFLPGNAFATWLDERTRAAGVADGLAPDLAERIRTGDLRAVGDLEVRYGPANRSARTTVERVAYLVPRPYSDETEWHVQPDTSAAGPLAEALRRVVDEMVRTDPQMRGCLGSDVPAEADRSEQLRCYAEMIARRFGER